MYKYFSLLLYSLLYNRVVGVAARELHFYLSFYFGHWHNTMQYKRGTTTFVCLEELDWIDVDLSNSEQMHQAVYEKFKT
jgi:hypothetical protein